MHTSVLLHEAVSGLNVHAGGRYIDATFGSGGHSREIVKQGGAVLAFDLDEQVVAKYQNNMSPCRLVRGNFADIASLAKENGFVPCDGIILDLGISMDQLDMGGRGFSYKRVNEPLDMRISETFTETAADILITYGKKDLERIFMKYGEETKAQPIVTQITAERMKRPIKFVRDLTNLIDRALGTSDTHVYARVFQSLRIVVNHEFENLTTCFAGIPETLKSKGRLCVITFHSLEDRRVKRLAQTHMLVPLTKKPITSRRARFERSAKLRIFEKI